MTRSKTTPCPETTKKGKRDVILDAAFQLFLKKGYTNTKIIDIAELAGIGKGTVYEYFSSKEDLFSQLMQEKLTSSYRDIDRIISSDETAEQKLRSYICYDIEIMQNYSSEIAIFPNIIVESEILKNSEIRNTINSMTRRKFSLLYGIICQGIENGEFNDLDPLMLTTSLIGGIHFFMSFNYNLLPLDILSPCEKKEWAVDDFLAMIMDGIRRK